ncbi:MAG: HIT family protein [Hyphomicrobiales bacterium]|nr:HIT family protein [Alphaproteobacteria bacterium]
MFFPPSLADWELDPLLERDTAVVGDMPLCRVLLIKDATYPWLLLVPRRHLAMELTDLDTIQQAQLMSEIAHASRVLKELTDCDKINVAALGNVVAQLHVHVIARSRGDAAWPRPVWNAVPPRDYDKAALDKLMVKLRERLTLTPL